jgi:hypothetical protein
MRNAKTLPLRTSSPRLHYSINVSNHIFYRQVNHSIARTSATHLANDDASAHAHPSNFPRHIHTQLMQAKPYYHSFNQLYLLIITANRMRTYRLRGILTIYSNTPHYVYIVKAAKPPKTPMNHASLTTPETFNLSPNSFFTHSSPLFSIFAVFPAPFNTILPSTKLLPPILDASCPIPDTASLTS